MAQAQNQADRRERLGAALDDLFAALGNLADACSDDAPESVAREVAATVFVDEASRRAVRWTRAFLATLEAAT